MAVGEVKTSTPRKLGNLPDFSKVQIDVRPAPAGRDTYVPAPQAPEAPQPQAAPEPQITPEQERLFNRIGATVGAGIGALFSWGFLKKAAALVKSGKPVGIGLGKVVPIIGAAIGAWGLVKKATVEWKQEGNSRKWDDLIRMAGDGMQVAGGIAALVPAIGLIPGLTLQLAAIGVSWLGDMFNDSPAKATNPLEGLFGGNKGETAKK
ncbi:MAG: hypothetical protein FJZ01_21035 [Candidatus Sericytochromatia bacterium]|nr:hypothetical protein [Candidatus Tanganyikabacteria bacterium]